MIMIMGKFYTEYEPLEKLLLHNSAELANIPNTSLQLSNAYSLAMAKASGETLKHTEQ